ncbi:MAG: glycosyltransferase [Bacteroidetes bacterium]|nr:glycosyltransferase [Bacteroidota bacterium]
MIKLSVIIVNYNVKYFLEQAIQSVIKACENIETEIIVVDNNSVDGSVEFIESKFIGARKDLKPEIKIIANKQNTGFAKANNQGLQIAKGKYILLLNPDTVVEEDTFEKCLSFMDAHADAGALGVKMIDGKGIFLPESKRAFPSPEVAFYKAFGLAALFPRSKVFGKYHLGYIGENETCEVDVLAGAFMLLRKDVLDKIGFLDEDFFMYGEDIDLSYRIVKAGYKNYYFPETRIIHYKGESTKKASFNYVKMFYNAMKIFANKHFSGRRAGIFVMLLNIAIYFRALIAGIVRLFKKIAIPFLDAIIIFGGLVLIKEYWEYYVKYIEGGEYPIQYLLVNAPLYCLIWILSIYISGGYDRTTNITKIVRGIFWGTLVIAAVYGFFPEQYRFSRGMIIAGAAYSVFVLLLYRSFIHFVKYRNFRFGEEPDKKILIIGNSEETKRAHQLLNQLQLGNQIVGYVTMEKNSKNEDLVLGSVESLKELTSVYKANELIFCAKDISSQEIINWMVALGQNIDYKIIPDQSLSIIGSNSKNTAGDIYTVDIKLKISLPEQRRAKRFTDIFLSFVFLIASPILVFFVKNKVGFFRNIFLVIKGKNSWVGYYRKSGAADSSEVNANTSALPAIKPGVLHPLPNFDTDRENELMIARINFIYAKDYRVSDDLEIIISALPKLGDKAPLF